MGRHASEATPPLVQLDGPTPAAARRAVAETLHDSGLSADDMGALQLAVSEVVTNAHVHGEPPVRVRIWRLDTGGAVVTVRDSGPGFDEPASGRGPVPQRSDGGLGMHIARRACRSVTSHRDDDGFTVVLVAGPST